MAMDDATIIRTIAEDRGWKPHIVDYWVHSEKEGALCLRGTQRECLEWRDRLPDTSPYKKWDVIPHYSDPPNYLNDHNAAHELIEVLRGEGWIMTWSLDSRSWGMTACKAGEQTVSIFAPTFCRAIAECYLKVRGKL